MIATRIRWFLAGILLSGLIASPQQDTSATKTFSLSAPSTTVRIASPDETIAFGGKIYRLGNFMVAWASPQQSTSIPIPEPLKSQGEVILLKQAAARKESEELQMKLQAIKRLEQEYVSQKRLLESELFRTLGLSPSEWMVVWDKFTVAPVDLPMQKPAVVRP